MSVSPLRECSKVHYPSIFLSDIHLGSRGCQAELLALFLKQHSCDRLYLVGDIIDGWRLKQNLYWPPSHSEVLRRFLTLSNQGTEVVYVTGNHDEFLRKYSDLEVGNIRLVNAAIHESLQAGKLLVTHGDKYDVVTRYYAWLAFLGDAGYSLLLEMNVVLNWIRARFDYGYWSLSAWIKQRVKRAVNFISEFEEAVAHDCCTNGFDGVICGHIHHAEITRYGTVSYMNCGDWVESCTALVEDERGEFHIIRWAQEVADRSADLVTLNDNRSAQA